MSKPKHVFLVGASRGVGREIAFLLREKGIAVTTLMRHRDAQSQLEELGIAVKIGDALRLDDVERAMQTDCPIDAVVSTIGGISTDGVRVDYLGNKHLIDTYATKTRESGTEMDYPQKFLLVSSIGSGNSAVALPPQALQALAPALAEKQQAEDRLIASGLIYTVIRPGGLKSEPVTGNGMLTEDFRISGTIHRADVAELVYKCLISDRANNKILSALDRNTIYGQTVPEEFQLELVV
jgi:NAD(P)-dependent dehydrogenase (short-subunit alcohol dehydrogenase family)